MDRPERGKPLLTMARNALSVLAAILVAFALDAWWDDRVEGHRTTALVSAVGVEFDQAVAQLDSVIAVNTAAIDAAQRFLERSRRRVNPAPVRADSLIVQASNAGAGQTYEPSFGALTTLLSAGGLEDVEDLELQRALADWPSRLAEVDFEIRLLESAYHQLFNSYASVDALLPRPYLDSLEWSAVAIDAGTLDDLRRAIWVLTAGMEAYTDELRTLRHEAARVAALVSPES